MFGDNPADLAPETKGSVGVPPPYYHSELDPNVAAQGDEEALILVEIQVSTGLMFDGG